MTDISEVSEPTSTQSSLEETIVLLQESLAEVQRAMDKDNEGWELAVYQSANEAFTADFRKRIAAKILVAVTAHPLIKRGVELREAYVWGGGVTIATDDSPDQGQDVNAVLQAFLDDPDNQETWTAMTAQVANERDLCISGEIVFCLPTDPQNGRVRVRKLKPLQITQIYLDPEDEFTEQYYLREWVDVASQKQKKALYPRLGYTPVNQPPEINGIEIRWNQPIYFLRVNKVGDRGVGDAFAAVPWANAYKRYLQDWAAYMKSLVKYAWRLRTRGDKVRQAAKSLQSGTEELVGSGFASDPNTYLEAISKSSASIDADSGRPLATMIAAGLNIPVTTLLGDPGITGTRATAEVVSADSEAVFHIRQELWKGVLAAVCDYVIDSAVAAPTGALRGYVETVGDRRIVTLPPEDSRTLKIKFHEKNSGTVLDAVRAVQLVDQSELLPPIEALRMYLRALEVENVDEIIKLVQNDQGEYIPADVRDASTRDQLERQGRVA